MFCYQCQEAMGNKGCATAKSVCGKEAPSGQRPPRTICPRPPSAWAPSALSRTTSSSSWADPPFFGRLPVPDYRARHRARPGCGPPDGGPPPAPFRSLARRCRVPGLQPAIESILIQK
jgi:hypothetical protein